MILAKLAERPPVSRKARAALLVAPAAGPSAPSASAAPPEPLSRRLPAAVADAQRIVERIRGVPFRAPVASSLLPERELPRVLEKKLLEDLPVAFDKYAAALTAVGLIEPTPDLARKVVNLYSRQVVGFYDPKERRFYVVPERAGATPPSAEEGSAEASAMVEEALLVHELTHALQDQRLDLARRMKGLRESSDSLLALQAFLEGEATVVMAEALLDRVPPESRALLPPDSLAQMLQGLSATGASAMEEGDGVPEYFVKELLFPYVAGTAWIQGRRGAGASRSPADGWAAVDAAYRRLPQTTSEILHPDRAVAFRLRLPDARRPAPSELPEGTRPLFPDTFGEWVLKTLLENAGAGESAPTLAAAWQDDRILFFERPGTTGHQIGFLWRIRVSTPEDAARLAEALEPLYTDRPPSVRPSIRTDGDVVEVCRGVHRATAAPPVTELPGPASPPAGSGRAGSR